MKPELEKKLFKKYPEIFQQKDLDMSQTAMCWGMQCGNGWYTILDKLCGWISWNMKNNSHCYPKIEFTTVKEKFGLLRIYYHPIDMTDDQKSGADEIAGAISFIETLSATICEDCGLPGKLYSVDGWYITACPKHLKSYIAYIKKSWGKKTVKVVDCDGDVA